MGDRTMASEHSDPDTDYLSALPKMTLSPDEPARAKREAREQRGLSRFYSLWSVYIAMLAILIGVALTVLTGSSRPLRTAGFSVVLAFLMSLLGVSAKSRRATNTIFIVTIFVFGALLALGSAVSFMKGVAERTEQRSSDSAPAR